jgi:hypothetical protein
MTIEEFFLEGFDPNNEKRNNLTSLIQDLLK